MSEEQRPPDESEPTRLDADDVDATIESGGPPDDGSPGKRLGDFELLRELGRGGMGIVFEARQLSLKRRVALKVLPPALGMTAQAKQRFEREAQAAAKLHHTHIVPVHAIGEHDGHHFYAMELIDGQSLDHVLRDMVDEGSNPLMDATVTQTVTELRPQRAATSSQDQVTTSLSDTSAGGREWFDTVAKLTADVADALHYAHGRGVIHRDVKPGNLMLSREGQLSITDFGLARLLEEPGMTVSGSFLGTPAYMAPEQIAAGRIQVDHRADIYSLGAVLYELLTMQRPFGGQSREQVLAAVMTKDPRPPRRFNGKIPVDLETICLKALEKDVDRRYATAGGLAQDLRQYLQGGLIAARRAGLWRRAAKSIRRHPVAATVAVAAIVVGLLGTVSWRALTGERAAGVERRVADARLMLTQGDLRGALEATNGILATDPDHVDGLLIRARVSLQRYHYREAVDDARRVLAGDPESWEAHLLVAAAAKKGSLFSIPIDRHLEAVEASVPDTADAHFLRGLLAAYDPGRAREAIGLLDRALELDPGHALALETRSDEHGELKNLPAAMADAERLIAANPRSVQGYIEKASVFHENHDQDSALAMANKVIELDPENPGGYYWRAVVHRERGQRSDEISDLSRAIDLDPTDSHFRRRADAYRWSGEIELAVADARRSIELEPDCAYCYQTLFWTYWWSNRREEAIDVLNEFEERAEDWVQEEGQVWRHRLWLDYYLQIEDHERALEHATRWVELRPRWIFAYDSRLGVRRLAAGESAVAEDCDLLGALELDTPFDFAYRGNVMRDTCHREDKALANYARAIELAPAWADPYVRRALLHKKNKRFDEALADMSRAIEVAPNWVDAYFWRGQTYADMERFEEALADYERDVELGGEGANLRFHQATALHRLGRLDDALRVLEEFLAENPKMSWAHVYLAIEQFTLGRVDEALETLDLALEIDPEDSNASMFRAFYSAFGAGPCPEIAKRLEDYEERRSSDPITWSNVAYVHGLALVYSCPEFHDPAKALKLAEKAASYDSTNASYQKTLGISLYRAARHEEARDALRQGLELQESTLHVDCVGLFTQALVHWQLGEERKAREFYRRGVELTEKTHNQGRPEAVLIRKEAAELLGVE